LQSTENKVKLSQIDKEGNINFGIKDYIDLPNIRYQHAIGMMGFDVAVTLERAGYRIKRRRIQKRKIPKGHRINKEEVGSWLKEKFGVQVE
jgi:large subunit ribosomal protein L5